MEKFCGHEICRHYESKPLIVKKKKKKKFRESMEDRKSAKSFVFSIVADYKIKCTWIGKNWKIFEKESFLLRHVRSNV